VVIQYQLVLPLQLKIQALQSAYTPNIPAGSKTVITAVEGDNITVVASALNPELDSTTAGKFANTYSGGTYSLTGDDAALFTMTNASTGAFTNVSALDFENPTDDGTDNTYKFNVVYTQGTNVFTDAVELKITDSTPPTSATTAAGTTVLSTAETTAAATPMSFSTTGTGGKLSAKFQEFAQADYANNAYGGAFTLTAHSADGVFTEAVQLNVTDSTADAGTSLVTTVVSEVAEAGKSTIAVDSDGAAAGAFDPVANAGDLAKLSTDAQAFVTAAGGIGNITIASTHANANTSGAAATLAIPASAANVQGVATMVLTSSGGSNSTQTFSEVVTFDITGSQGATAVGARSTDLATQSLTTFSGGTSGGEAVAVDLDDAGNNAKFADLHAFRTAHTGGAYALTANSTVSGAADFTLNSDNELVLAKGAGAGTYTATVTYTSGSDVFTQKVSITTTDATEAGAATGSQTSTADTAAATRTSTEATSGKSSLLIDEARSGTIKSVGTGLFYQLPLILL
jgi:hypothetical protein